MLKKFDMKDSAPVNTHISTKTKFDLDPKGKKVDQKVYRGMVGSIMYLTATRPYILFTTCLCARFQTDPKESHLIAIKRIFIYLKGTQNLGMWYPKDSGLDLVSYLYSDYAGCRIKKKVLLRVVNFLLEDLFHGLARNNILYPILLLKLGT